MARAAAAMAAVSATEAAPTNRRGLRAVIRCLQHSPLSRSALVKFVADADFDVAAERVRDGAELGRLLDAAP